MGGSAVLSGSALGLTRFRLFGRLSPGDFGGIGGVLGMGGRGGNAAGGGRSSRVASVVCVLTLSRRMMARSLTAPRRVSNLSFSKVSVSM